MKMYSALVNKVAESGAIITSNSTLVIIKKDRSTGKYHIKDNYSLEFDSVHNRRSDIVEANDYKGAIKAHFQKSLVVDDGGKIEVMMIEEIKL